MEGNTSQIRTMARDLELAKKLLKKDQGSTKKPEVQAVIAPKTPAKEEGIASLKFLVSSY